MRRFTLLSMLLLSVGCAAHRPVGFESRITEADPPEWTVRPMKFDTKEAKAFCGVSHNVSSEALARDNALENARKQIVDAMGTYGKHVIDQVISAVGTAGSVLDPALIGDDANKLVSEGMVKTRAKEFHIEKWARTKPGGEIDFYYKAYVLVLWNNKDAEEAVAESIRRQSEAKVSQAERRNLERALEQMKRLQSEDW